MTVPPAQAAHDERPDRRGYASGKADYLSRLAKIEGQVRGLQRPGDRGDLDHHVGAVGAGLDHLLHEAAVGFLIGHLHHCVVNAAQASEDDGQASLGEVASTIRQVIRL